MHCHALSAVLLSTVLLYLYRRSMQSACHYWATIPIRRKYCLNLWTALKFFE
jgi:hypothetical protein